MRVCSIDPYILANILQRRAANAQLHTETCSVDNGNNSWVLAAPKSSKSPSFGFGKNCAPRTSQACLQKARFQHMLQAQVARGRVRCGREMQFPNCLSELPSNCVCQTNNCPCPSPGLYVQLLCWSAVRRKIKFVP